MPNMTFTTAEIAKHLEGEVVGDATAPLKGFAPAASAKPGDLTFAENEDYFARAEQSAATAIIADKRFKSAKKILIRVPDARIAFAKAMALFFPEKKFAAGIHPTAVIAASAKVDATAHIGPHCVVGERVKIGAGSVLQAGDVVGDDCKLADDVNLFPNVTVYPHTEIGRRVRIHAGTVIGSDGFGYVQDGGMHRKVPQIGNVVIGDDVEIGANVTIDRGALGPTVIGKGTKIDNLVQIAHNVEIGEGSLIISQVGICRQQQVWQIRHPRRTGRFCRTFENRRSRHRLGAIGRDDRHSGRRKMAWLAGATGQASQTPDDCHPAPAGAAQARRGVGKEARREILTQRRGGAEGFFWTDTVSGVNHRRGKDKVFGLWLFRQATSNDKMSLSE